MVIARCRRFTISCILEVVELAVHSEFVRESDSTLDDVLLFTGSNGAALVRVVLTDAEDVGVANEKDFRRGERGGKFSRENILPLQF